MQAPFFRMGEPVILTVSPTSGSTEVPVTIPTGATCFKVTNNNPFAVRLRGTAKGQAFQPVTSTTGWLWGAGVSEINGTVYPRSLAAMSVDGAFAAFDVAQKAGTGTLELQSGTGI